MTNPIKLLAGRLAEWAAGDTLAIANGGTGAATALDARIALSAQVAGYITSSTNALVNFTPNNSDQFVKTGALTANRPVNLLAVTYSMTVRIGNKTTGGFSVLVNDAGTAALLKTVAPNSWGDFTWDTTGLVWVQTGAGAY